MSTANQRSAAHILIIEDDADIRELVAYNLEREGYRVSQADDGDDGIRLAHDIEPDLVLLDLMLPGSDGIEVCRQLKSDATSKHLPIIMITAKGEEADIVLGLSMGADDYVTKPFSPRELLARIKAVLRRSQSRSQAPGNDERLSIGGIVIDPARHEVRIDDQRQTFTATEFKLLHTLASHPGRVFTRDQLISRVMGDDAIIIDRNVDVHVRSVRKKIGPYRDYIETVRGVGYRFTDN
ncbi:MAG: response regulator [Planctomycetota bacterium]|jgi:two-component system phosphate regulon response regulator PhoB